VPIIVSAPFAPADASSAAPALSFSVLCAAASSPKASALRVITPSSEVEVSDPPVSSASVSRIAVSPVAVSRTAVSVAPVSGFPVSETAASSTPASLVALPGVQWPSEPHTSPVPHSVLLTQRNKRRDGLPYLATTSCSTITNFFPRPRSATIRSRSAATVCGLVLCRSTMPLRPPSTRVNTLSFTQEAEVPHDQSRESMFQPTCTPCLAMIGAT